jgi:hypothetical protein
MPLDGATTVNLTPPDAVSHILAMFKVIMLSVMAPWISTDIKMLT